MSNERIPVICPVCSHEVTALIDPGEPPTRYPGEGGRPMASDGAPAVLDDVEGCECIEAVQFFTRVVQTATDERWESGESWYEREMLSRASERVGR